MGEGCQETLVFQPRSRGFPAGLLDRKFYARVRDVPESQSPFERAYV
jgi:hypothetical protein